MKTIRKIAYIFTKKQKRRFVFVIFIIAGGSILELLGVSAILPFINIISDKSIIHTNQVYSWLYDLFKVESDLQFMIGTAVVLILIYVIKNVYLLFMYNSQYRFTYDNQRWLAKRLVSCYMNQPYLFHLSKNISELQRNIISDVGMFYNAVLAVIQSITELIVCLLISIYLFVIEPTITLGVVSLLSVFALIYLIIVRKKSIFYGKQSRDAYEGMFKWIRQAFEGIKEVKILNRENYFEKRIDEEYDAFSQTTRKSNLLSAIPRPMFESVCVSALLIVISIKLAYGADVQSLIPVLSAFAMAAFRMLPSFGRLASYFNAISYNKSAINAVYEDLIEAEQLEIDRRELSVSDIIQFNDSIKIEKLSFGYPNTDKLVLNHVTLSIPKNKSVAFVGPSGAGKSTLADLILGILTFNQGHIYVDGQDISENTSGWHRMLGYIPQSIYLMDDSIRNNILFGIPEEEADEESIRRALRDAQILDFVNELKDGIHTVIGERGIRVSGGQRQRIGIARALYNNPEVLVLDEATSALDHDTESAVMDAVNGLKGQKTLIIIAHRLSTIENCDIVYEVKDGTVKCTKK